MNKRVIPITLIMVLLIFSSLGIGSLNVLGEKELGSVHGTVVDENDSFIKDVNVSVYDEYGKKLASDLTDEEGFFRFALYGGNYRVLIEKKGYVRVERSITVPDNVGLFYEPEFDPVDMGVITLKRILKLSTPVLVRVVEPDSTVTLPITITNLSDKIEEIELSTYNPAGWDMRILDQSGEVRKILLSSESSTSLIEEIL
ncbi:carboxypeptidase regulatory-like domain-containing protein [Candidatus Bathyarchaeota archaeon]|nr:carboxypeptidase regulatory-like domain-containing protein [Candidatus Bathyarchaeota archaeon]